MDIFHNLAFGFEHALTMQNLMFCAIGCTVGTLVGLLPGLGPLATIDGGNLRFEIGDDVRREGADVQKDHYHHHDIFQS